MTQLLIGTSGYDYPDGHGAKNAKRMRELAKKYFLPL